MSIVNSVLRVPDFVYDLMADRLEKAAAKKAKQAPAEAAPSTTPAPSKSTYTPPPAKDYRDVYGMPGKRF